MNNEDYEKFLDEKQARNEITYRDIKEPWQVCGKDCPWTGFSYGVDMGCLPAPVDFVESALQRGEILSCHSNYKIPCKGIKDFLTRRGLNPSSYKLIPNKG